MSTRDRLFFAVLLLDSVVLALVEMLYLPLRLDGFLLPDFHDLPLPVTIVLAAVTMPVLVSQASRLSPHTWVSAAPLLVWLLCLGVVGLTGPGGDRVLIQDWRALLLIAAGALPAALKLGGPR